MPEAGELPTASDDEKITRITAERLTATTHKPAAEVEAAVRDELARRRTSARIQTFVPIFAERAARQRLAS